jgi:hypothetical protein
MVKLPSEYTPAEWAGLFPEQRYAAKQAESDRAMGRSAIPVRSADGRSTVYIDPITRKPVPAAEIAPARRMG